MRTVAIANLKGGVGKTTLTHNLAGVLAERGHRVLLVDLDHQANLSTIYIPNLMEQEDQRGMTHALFDGVPLSEVIRSTPFPGVSIAPSDLDLNFLDQRSNNELASHFLLADLLQPQRAHFDYALIDCPPHMGMALGIALVAADAFIVPLDADPWGYRGSQRIQDAVRKTKGRANQNIAFLGYVASKIQPRNRLTRQMLAFFREQFGSEMMPTCIRESVKYREASARGLPITRYLPTSQQAEDFRKLTDELHL